MKLMIVDDHAGVRKLIGQMAALPGDVLRECRSGDEALRVVGEFEPDCVTLDLRMPGLCAFKTARALRAARPALRIIVVTSYDQPEFRRCAAEAGTDGYVVKENLADLRELLVPPAAGN